MSPPEAFALLVLPNVSLTQNNQTETGILALECVTVDNPGHSERDVYLVLRVNQTETPIDPDRVVQRIDGPNSRIFLFAGTHLDPSEINLAFHLSPTTSTNYYQDLETFESIIGQYNAELRGPNDVKTSSGHLKATTRSLGPVPIGGVAHDKDLRGHLVMVDEKTGEVVGQVEDRFRLREDPIMHTQGHENDPVVIEVAEGYGADDDAHALEAFVRAIPPDQQNWITKGASVVSSAITLGTNLVVTTINTASNYYIAHSAPSPHHSAAASGASTPVPGASGSSKDPGQLPTGSPPPIPPRPRALVFLTSEQTRQNLGKVQAVSGRAVQVSGKTVAFVDNMIRKAIGAGAKRDKKAFLRANSDGGMPPAQGSYAEASSSKSGGLVPPPAYSPSPTGGPSTPTRRSTSPVPPPLPPRDKPLSTKDRVLISADLILSTIDHSTRQLLDAGTTQLGRVMHHKYGEEAAESSLLVANTARNVGLVYVDMRGVGRRALLRRAGRTYVKSKFSSKKPGADGQPSAAPDGADIPPAPPMKR